MAEREKAWNIALGAISIPHAQSLKPPLILTQQALAAIKINGLHRLCDALRARASVSMRAGWCAATPQPSPTTAY